MGVEVIDRPIGLIDLDAITLEGFSQSLPTITLSSSSIHILVTMFLLPSERNDTALHIRPQGCPCVTAAEVGMCA